MERSLPDAHGSFSLFNPWKNSKGFRKITSPWRPAARAATAVGRRLEAPATTIREVILPSPRRTCFEICTIGLRARRSGRLARQATGSEAHRTFISDAISRFTPHSKEPRAVAALLNNEVACPEKTQLCPDTSIIVNYIECMPWAGKALAAGKPNSWCNAQSYMR